MDFRHPPGDNPRQGPVSSGDAMRVKHYAQGKFYVIECPEGTRLVRRSSGGEVVKCDHLVVPLKGEDIRIPADPPELLPMLAESGNFGISLVGKPLPDVNLAGVVCPKCGEDDVNWLQVREDSKTVHCDRCGTEFVLPVLGGTQVTGSRRTGGEMTYPPLREDRDIAPPGSPLL
jgi:predicted RNA-binding Zn-ribbon protein involved in translation (DUF1610 family)